MANTVFFRVCRCGRIHKGNEDWVFLDRTISEFFRLVCEGMKNGAIKEVHLIKEECSFCKGKQVAIVDGLKPSYPGW